MSFSLDNILPNILIIPMITHWVLPDSIESIFYIDLGYFDFYVFNVLFFFYMYGYNKINISFSSRYLAIKKVVNILCLLFLLFAILNLICNESDDILKLIINNFSFIFFLWLFFNFPLNSYYIKKTKLLLFITLFVLSLEVVLFSFGLIHYTSATGNEIEGETFEDFMRVSTTIGAATGTSLVLVILGSLCVLLEESRFFKLCVYLIATVAIVLTLSRGGILTWALYSFCYFYRYYYVVFSLKKRFVSIVLMLFLLFILSDTGILDAVLSRNDRADGDVTNGRMERFEKGLITYYNSSYYGVGMGRVYPDKCIVGDFYSPYFSAPHNYYIIVLAENGIIGLIIVVLLLIVVLFAVDYNLLTSYILVLLLLVNFNTEGIWGYSEFASLFAFLAMSSIKGKLVFSNYKKVHV